PLVEKSTYTNPLPPTYEERVPKSLGTAADAPKGLVADSATPPSPAATAPKSTQVPTTSPRPYAPQQDLPPLQVVNSRMVTLEYQLDKVGHAGVGRVKLYLTDNDGKTWQEYAEDDDPKPSGSGRRVQRTVELPGEGVFGLRLVGQNRPGRGKQPPLARGLPG